MENNHRRAIGQWLKDKIFPLKEDKVSDAYYYYLSLPINRNNSRELYKDVDRHQFLLYLARYYLNTIQHNFTYDIPRSLLSAVIGNLYRSASDSEKYKADMYCKRFNEFIADANKANQNYYYQRDLAAADNEDYEDNTIHQNLDVDDGRVVDQDFLRGGSSF
ncbi:4187_t:CDS:1 [Entrophospora sp. SA101]|nr:4187_t:CDS:1 [Entrophospora sp. SA101]